LTALYEKHPVRNDIAGTVESIAKIDKDLLYKCYHSFYNPSNMILFTCGDVECDKVAQVVDKYVTNAPLGEIKRIFPNEPENVNKKLVEQKLSVANPLFMIGFKDNDLGKTGSEMMRKIIVTEILNRMLVGKSSKTYNSLYEKGLINDSFFFEYSCEADYAFAAMGGESTDPNAAKEEILEGIKKAELLEEDFLRCKKSLIGRFLRMFNSVEGLSNVFVSSIFQGMDMFEYLDICESVTLEEARLRKEYLFREENCAMSIVWPN